MTRKHKPHTAHKKRPSAQPGKPVKSPASDKAVAATASPREKDRIFERDGVRVFVDGKSFLYLAGSELNYEQTLMSSMFKVQNPNVKSTCGCGESFSV